MRDPPRNGQPLSGRTRHTYLSPLLSFFRETSQWGWDDVPGRPLLGKADFRVVFAEGAP
jgi:hypothetical protein